MTVWFSADFHIGHANIIKHCSRPFENVEEMNNKILSNCNKYIMPEDTFYYLGDLAWNEFYAKQFFEKLHCKQIIYILGNHDSRCENVIKRYAKEVHQLLRVKFKDVDKRGRNIDNFITMCHYPMLTWAGSNRGSIMCHGHSHGNVERFKKANMPNARIFDVGVDVWDFKPVSFDNFSFSRLPEREYTGKENLED